MKNVVAENDPEISGKSGPQIEYLPENRSPWHGIKYVDAFRLAPFAYELYQNKDHLKLRNFIHHSSVHNIRSLVRLELAMDLDEERTSLHRAIKRMISIYRGQGSKFKLYRTDYQALKLYFDLAEELKIYKPKQEQTINEYSFQPLEKLLLLLAETSEKSEKTEMLLPLIRERLKSKTAVSELRPPRRIQPKP